MPSTTFAEIEPILLHPFTRLAAAAVAAALLGPLVWLLTASLGVDDAEVPGLRSLRWSRVAGALATLFGVTALFAYAFPGMSDQAAVVSGLLVRVAAGCMCLFAAAWVGKVRGALAEDRAAQAEAARHVGHVWLVGGIAAAVAMIETGPALLVVLALVFFAVRSLVTRGEPAKRIHAWLLDLAAGIPLRERLTAGMPITVDDEAMRLRADPGLFATELDATGGPRSLRNTQVLEALERRAARPAPASETAG